MASIIEIYKAIKGSSDISIYSHLVGLALGASICSLFLRINGGIYAKAADIGADLLGRDNELIHLNPAKNPLLSSELCGDLLSDLLSSTTESLATGIAVLTGTTTLITLYKDILKDEAAFYFPLLVYSFSLFVSLIISIVFSVVIKTMRTTSAIKLVHFQRFHYLV